MDYQEYLERKKNPPKCECGKLINLGEEMVKGLFGCIHIPNIVKYTKTKEDKQ